MGRNTANIIIVNNYTDTAKSEHESVMLCYAYLSILYKLNTNSHWLISSRTMFSNFVTVSQTHYKISITIINISLIDHK